ncbi:hypothetical protein EXD76_01900 [BEV proteobacterium]|nr:hypothetical protein [Candidatus Symbiopectobacterium sp. Chty_BC]
MILVTRFMDSFSSGVIRYGVSELCSTSLSPVDDLVSLSIDQIAQLGLSSLQMIYYSEQLFGVPFYYAV